MKRIIVGPIPFFYKGVICFIDEVSEHEWIDGKKHYIVTVECKVGDKYVRPFPLDVTSNKELVEKLKVEISKLILLQEAGLPV